VVPRPGFAARQSGIPSHCRNRSPLWLCLLDPAPAARQSLVSFVWPGPCCPPVLFDVARDGFAVFLLSWFGIQPVVSPWLHGELLLRCRCRDEFRAPVCGFQFSFCLRLVGVVAARTGWVGPAGRVTATNPCDGLPNRIRIGNRAQDGPPPGRRVPSSFPPVGSLHPG